MAVTHLTFTGILAGTRLCGSEEAAASAHAVYAPLHLADFRARCCPECLDVWEDDHTGPDDTPVLSRPMHDPRQLPLF